MTVGRRNFLSSLAAGAVAASLPSIAQGAAPVEARNVVLVHGLFADGSSWLEVIPHLQRAGLNVTSVQNPLDRTINPDLERFMARRMGATTIELEASHVSLISRPHEIARLILQAAGKA